MWRLTIAMAFLFIVACAHERTVVTQPNPAAPAPAAEAATDANGRPLKPAVNENLVKEGYRPSMRNGQLMYCRTEQPTGSRFTTQVCQNEAQILAAERWARDATNSAQRSH
jgi:hypothetical protein